LSPAQRDDIATVCDVGSQQLRNIARRLDEQGLTIRRSKVEALLREQAGDESGSAIARLAFGIAGTFRRTSSTAKEFLDRITPAIKAASADDPRLEQWSECRDDFERLLATDSLALSAKALDISYDFERVYLAGRVLTSIKDNVCIFLRFRLEL
jgi:hypothetical protein